jgi:hypothetical protein
MVEDAFCALAVKMLNTGSGSDHQLMFGDMPQSARSGY